VTDPGRRLSAVGPAPAREAAPAEGRSARTERAALAILGVLLAVSLVGLALSMGRNGRLDREVTALSAELEATRGALGAYESRLSEVRDAVARLNALLEGDPGAPAPPAPTADAPAP
jgi:type II secretory pathway pseudopilin PulG